MFQDKILMREMERLAEKTRTGATNDQPHRSKVQSLRRSWGTTPRNHEGVNIYIMCGSSSPLVLTVSLLFCVFHEERP